jgi:pSer/pThr/pTyr-binding forkhead associated (FHA) protein
MTQAPSTQPLELIDPHHRRISLAGAELIVGRSPECAIRLADDLASRRHFALRSSPFGWQVSDLGSSNGTFVNGHRLQPGDHRILSPGDHITVGSTTLQVRRAAPPPADQRDRLACERRPEDRTVATLPTWRWLVTISGALAMALLLTSAFSPWVHIEARLTLANVPGGEIIANAARLVQGLVQTVLGTPQPLPAAAAEPATLRLLEQTVGGMDTHAYGLIVLAVAIATAITLVLDIALAPTQRGAIGLAYLLLGLGPGIIFAVEYARFDQAARQPVLFGLDVMTLLKVSEQLMDIQVKPLLGLWLLAAGLLLVCATGLLRLLLPALAKPGRTADDR